MVLYLDENEYFSLNAYVQALGDQTVALSGYLVQHRPDGTYIAPLIPDLFFGVNGTQLQHSWRQNFTATGDQTILSRSGGEPSVPRNELYWRKISNNGQMKKEEVQLVEVPGTGPPPIFWVPAVILGAIVGGYILYRAMKH